MPCVSCCDVPLSKMPSYVHVLAMKRSRSGTASMATACWHVTCVVLVAVSWATGTPNTNTDQHTDHVATHPTHTTDPTDVTAGRGQGFPATIATLIDDFA